MSDPILTTEKVKWRDIYSKIISLLTEAGWEDVSSNSATDGNIMHSNGESGDMDLFLGFSKDAGGTDKHPFGSSVSATIIYVKLIYDYRPGVSGKSGTYDSRRNEIWRPILRPFGDTSWMSLDSDVYMHYHVNKNRILCYFEPITRYIYNASNVGNINLQFCSIQSPQFFTFGYQDSSLIKGTKSSSVIFACTSVINFATINYSMKYSALACSYASTVSSDAIYLQSYSFNVPREGTLDGGVPLLPILLGTEADGLLCCVDGLKVLSYNDNFTQDPSYSYNERFIADGDVVKLNNKLYRAYVYYHLWAVNVPKPSSGAFQIGILRINNVLGSVVFFRRVK